MFLDVAFIIGGLGLLLYCGDLLVRGAVGVAQRQKLPPMLIGLTIVAFGTSAPELFVSVHATLAGEGAEGIVIGNVVGSNIANILLVLGVPALIYPAVCDQPSARRNTVFMVGASLIFLWVCFNGNHAISMLEGVLLFGLIIAFLIYTYANNRNCQQNEFVEELNEIEGIPRTLPRIALLLAVALVGLPLGSYAVVEGAVSLAAAAMIPPAVVGLTIIALGTSLPELATTVMAAMRRHYGVAMGNVLGSNLFNILAIVGISAMIAKRPIAVDERLLSVDLWAMTACALLIVPYVFLRLKMGRWSGIAFITAYIGFVGTLIFHVV